MQNLSRTLGLSWRGPFHPLNPAFFPSLVGCIVSVASPFTASEIVTETMEMTSTDREWRCVGCVRREDMTGAVELLQGKYLVCQEQRTYKVSSNLCLPF